MDSLGIVYSEVPGVAHLGRWIHVPSIRRSQETARGRIWDGWRWGSCLSWRHSGTLMVDVRYNIICIYIYVYMQYYIYIIHIIYILYTYYIHIVYILYTYYIHIIYILYTYCIHIIYILYTYYIHIIYILYTYYIHIIYILYTYYIHIIYILYIHTWLYGGVSKLCYPNHWMVYNDEMDDWWSIAF